MKQLMMTTLVLLCMTSTSLANKCDGILKRGEAFLTTEDQEERLINLAALHCEKFTNKKLDYYEMLIMEDVVKSALAEAADMQRFDDIYAEKLAVLAISLYYFYDQLIWMDEGERRDITSLIIDWLSLNADDYQRLMKNYVFEDYLSEHPPTPYNGSKDWEHLFTYGQEFTVHLQAYCKKRAKRY